jgi:hypothetical protein
MASQQSYEAPGLDVAAMGEALGQWFQQQEYETQVLPGPGDGVTVQARKHKSILLRSMVALTITITSQEDKVLVQAGQAKWALQAVEGVAALIIFWPLLALPAYAAIKQKQLIDESMQFIDRYVAAAGGKQISIAPMPPAPMPTARPASQPEARCPSCSQPVRLGAKFCDHCGATLSALCENCGAALRPGARFCDSCGAAAAPASQPETGTADA